MATAEELLSTFQQPRLAPLGNTFLKLDEQAQGDPQEKLAARRKKMLSMAGTKAHSFNEFVPYQLQDVYEDLHSLDRGFKEVSVSRKAKIEHYFRSKETIESTSTIDAGVDPQAFTREHSLGDSTADWDQDEAEFVRQTSLQSYGFDRQVSGVPVMEDEAEDDDELDVNHNDSQICFERQRSYGMETESDYDFRWNSRAGTTAALTKEKDVSDGTPEEERATTWPDESRVNTCDAHVDTDDSDCSMSPRHRANSGPETFSPTHHMNVNIPGMFSGSPVLQPLGGSPVHQAQQVLGLQLRTMSPMHLPCTQMKPSFNIEDGPESFSPTGPPQSGINFGTMPPPCTSPAPMSLNSVHVQPLSPAAMPAGGPPAMASPGAAAFFRSLNNATQASAAVANMLPPSAQVLGPTRPPASIATGPAMGGVPGAWESPVSKPMPNPGESSMKPPAEGPISLLDQVKTMAFSSDLSISEGVEDFPKQQTPMAAWAQAQMTDASVRMPPPVPMAAYQPAAVDTRSLSPNPHARAVANTSMGQHPQASPASPTQKSNEGGRSPSKEDGKKPEGYTTLMVRNLPHDMLQSELAADVDSCGFKGQYDFLYMPSTFGTGRGKGYAFINFVSTEVAKKFSAMWHNTCRFSPPSERAPLNVSVASLQGREANVARWDTSKMRRIRNANHRPLVAVCMSKEGAVAGTLEPKKPASPEMMPASPVASVLPAMVAPGIQVLQQQQQQVAPYSEAMGPSVNLVGQQCKIQNLTQAPEMNGRWGMVDAYDAADQRYIVRIVSDNNSWFHAKLRWENLDLPPMPSVCRQSR